ncbi:ABC transporter transmembrane domain type 1 [Penicillium vulpinum]|uniref:ABC transporter transmembrane domain type 1 n=1 Tax=Penicillium vulpinum TaxID=29845 RepID=UPI00254926C4|nr:ABC transporter transmembrane domain type 1 [Penicillium vulpinum]KAJ5964054.1 ABC transporter transmembrane domain type 1 [Penicillium vulpinum]
MSRLIRYVNDAPTGDKAQIQGFKLLSATILIYIGSAILNGRRDAAKRRVMIAVKGSLTGILHEKILQCSDNSHSAIATIRNDVEDVQMVMGGKYASKHFVGKHRAWDDATQDRVSLIRTILEHLKTIKMMGYSHAMESKVQASRDTELKAGLVTAWLDVIMAASGSFLNVVSPSITLGLYTVFAKLTGRFALDADLIFTSFALIQMVTLPATSIILILPEFITVAAGFHRIQKFLLQPDHQDSRKLPEGQIEHFLAYIYTGQDQYRDITVGPLDSDDGHAIAVNFATVLGDTGDQPVLKNISLKIETGWLVLVAGVPGSGKTALVRTILGELKLLSGSVSTFPVNMAFCAQSSWLRNGTVRDIIAGPPGCRVTDEQWYQKVLHACDLDFDLLQLPNGDNTLVGDGGISLSEGQRQRLALARAVYSQLDILVLDDVLSALDGRAAHRVTQRLLGPVGLLRELNKTVVLTTNSTDLLQYSNLIVILNPDGSICEQGTWDEPKIQAWYSELDVPKVILPPGFEQGKHVQQINIPSPVFSTLEPSVESLRKPADSIIYAHYIGAIGRYRFLVPIIIFISSAAFAMLIQGWLRLWAEDDDTGKRVALYPGVYFALALWHWVLLTGIGTIEFLVVPTSGRRLHDQLLTTVINAPLFFITSTGIETTLSGFNQDMKQIDRKLPREIAALGSQAFKLLAQIILLCLSQAYNILVFPVLAIFVYFIQRKYLAASRQIRGISAEVNSLPNSFVETFEGITTIRAFGWQNAHALGNSRALDASQAPSYTLNALEQSVTLVVDLVVACIALANVAFIVASTGTMTAGDIGISMNVIMMLNMIFMSTVQSWANFDTSLSVICRIRNFATTVAPESQPKNERVIHKSWPHSGEISLRDVFSDYASTGEQISASDHALNGVSFKVKSGRKIGVCGPTGSGKSSLLLSFMRMIDLAEGMIKIDGVDLSSISRDLVRSRIITIPQDTFIISSDSVRGNLDVLGTSTDKKIIATLRKVRLWSSLQSRAIDTGLSPTFYLDVPMKAWPLSLGQLQLLSLARAILLRSSRGRIVLVEESTSTIDSETSGLIQQVIREQFQGYTIITVAHRLETIKNSDSIIVMDKGRIVEVGSFDALRQNEGAFRFLLDPSAL